MLLEHLYPCLAYYVLFFFEVSAFFSSSWCPKQFCTSLHSVVTWFYPQAKKCVTATTGSSPVKKLVQESLLLICAVWTPLWRMFLTWFNSSENQVCGYLGKTGSNLQQRCCNRNATAKEISTRMGRMDGDKSTNSAKQTSFTRSLLLKGVSAVDLRVRFKLTYMVKLTRLNLLGSCFP